MKPTRNLIGKRMITTTTTVGIIRNERTLLEISPSGKMAKWSNPFNDFWEDVDEVEILELLPKIKRPKTKGTK